MVRHLGRDFAIYPEFAEMSSEPPARRLIQANFSIQALVENGGWALCASSSSPLASHCSVRNHRRPTRRHVSSRGLVQQAVPLPGLPHVRPF